MLFGFRIIKEKEDVKSVIWSIIGTARTVKVFVIAAYTYTSTLKYL